MDNEKLTGLLERAIASGMQIRRPDAESKLPLSMVRAIERTVLVDQGLEREILACLEEDPALGEFRGQRMLNLGNGGSSTGVGVIVQWLLFEAKTRGATQAIDLLQKFTLSPGIPGIEVVPLVGVEVSSSVELHNGIALAPLKDLPQSYARDVFDEVEAALAGPFISIPGVMGRPVIPKVALVRSVRFEPKTFPPGGPVPPFASSREELYDVSACLTLVGQISAQPVGYWSQPDDWVPGALSGGGIMLESVTILPASNQLLTEAQQERAKAIIELYLNLRVPVRTHLSVPLMRLNLSRRRDGGVDRAIDLGIALESLLLGDREAASSLALAFRLRGAWLLGKDKSPPERRELVKLFYDLYDFRSQAVHSGKLKERGDQTKKSAKEVLSLGDGVCAEILEIWLRRGDIPTADEWAGLTLGDAI